MARELKRPGRRARLAAPDAKQADLSARLLQLLARSRRYWVVRPSEETSTFTPGPMVEDMEIFFT